MAREELGKGKNRETGQMRERDTKNVEPIYGDYNRSVSSATNSVRFMNICTVLLTGSLYPLLSLSLIALFLLLYSFS